jgi:hypothetical protein
MSAPSAEQPNSLESPFLLETESSPLAWLAAKAHEASAHPSPGDDSRAQPFGGIAAMTSSPAEESEASPLAWLAAQAHEASSYPPSGEGSPALAPPATIGTLPGLLDDPGLSADRDVPARLEETFVDVHEELRDEPVHGAWLDSLAPAQSRARSDHRPGTTTDDARRLAVLERENRELRRANAILKSAAVFFATELDRLPR